MRREEAGNVQRPRKTQVGKTCQHFSGLQPWMSDTEEFLPLDPALKKQAVNVKKMEPLKKKVERKVTNGGMGGMEAEVRSGMQGRGTGLGG